jgi:phenylpropionate dioxygenase-like ring-hydroxylating dioxygenase large terminal subunit
MTSAATTRYRNNPDAIRALVREGEVHRDVYTDPELFEIEMAQLFGNTWVYVGHASQVPNAGDFLATTIGTQPVVMTRDGEGRIHVLHNRCPHKGTKVANETCGNAGRLFRCPYHGWSFRMDGALHSIPVKEQYDGTGFAGTTAAQGMARVRHVHDYRDFVFAKLNDAGPDFHDYFGPSLSSLDNMIDRSPVGRLEVAGGVLRYLHRCNWKMLVENLTDTTHPMIAHESSAGTAKALGAKLGRPHPAVEIYAPFVSPYEFYDRMGIRIWPNGHGHTGVHGGIHSNYGAIPGYFEAMVAAYGEARARAILDENRHNTVYFPNMTMKGPIQALRIFKPLAVDRTMVESWTFRLVGAPDQLLARTILYSRLINAPSSPVGHDDLEMYERAQESLHSDANRWVNMQRLYSTQERERPVAEIAGLSEWQMRNQYRAWRHYMTLDPAYA